MRARKSHLRDEQGIALVLVIIIGLVLTTVSAVLVTALVSENTGSSHAVVRQQSFQAAEAGLNSYASKLIEDGLFYSHYVAPGESTRKDPVTGTLVSAGNPWPYGLSWTYPNGHDWVAAAQLPEQLRVQPADRPAERRGVCDADEPAVRCDHDHCHRQAACRRQQGRLAGDPGDDPAELDLGLLPDRQRRRLVREHHNHEREGLRRREHQPRRHGDRESLRRRSGHRLDHVPGAGRESPADPAAEVLRLQHDAARQPGRPAAQLQRVPGLRLDDLRRREERGHRRDQRQRAILRRQHGRRGRDTNTQKNYMAPTWVWTFNSNGTFTIKVCTPSSGTDPAARRRRSRTCGTSATFNVPTNGAIYSASWRKAGYGLVKPIRSYICSSVGLEAARALSAPTASSRCNSAGSSRSSR